MTHGEELGSDVHQDSIVLTYLEGLLMHQAAEGSGTAIDKKSARRNEEDQNFNISGNAFPTCQSNGPVLNTHTYQGSGMLHLKKARLLQSSEDWNAAKRKRLSESIVNLNVKKEALLAGMVDNVPKGKQDSTLLASLLQSFSSRLQTVALSQQIRQSLKEQGYALTHDSLKVEKDLRCYGVASSHLKTLLKKSKAKDQKPDTSLSDVTKNPIRDRFVETPHHVGQSGTKVISEPLSCAARLQAVASMVEKRASPATSPKPSVACSQLALLLSSEAHLQQYSREHALKTQNANQAASERLAAMARLQENGQKDASSFQISKGMSSHLNGQARTSGKLLTSRSTAFQNPMSIVPTSPKNAGYKNSLERNNIKQAANNSLLLHLLKSQTIPKPMNGHSQSERGSIFEDSSTPTTIDEYSDNNPSFTDDSSGDESSYSNCVPIDLSCKHRLEKPETDQPVSLDNFTQSLLNTWDPKVPDVDVREDQDTSKNSKLNSHQKVTLLQLLLGHKNEENIERNSSPQEVQSEVTKFNAQNYMRTSVIESPSTARTTPVSTPPLLASTKAESPINLSQHSLVIKWNSPPYACSTQSEKPSNTASNHLMDLTRSKESQGEKQVQNEGTQNSANFSASKLLQNLAQCGMQSSSSSAEEQRLSKQLLSVNTDKPVGMIERLNSPLLTNKTNAVEENKTFSNHSAGPELGLSGSEIENLLERRTVLQLLLGNPNKGKSEKKEKIPLRDESTQEHTDRALSEQILMVKIKSEPSDDLHSHNTNVHLSHEAKATPFIGMGSTTQRSTAALPASEDFKSDPISPQDFSFSKNGLLSRLLRQNQETYLTDDLDSSHRNSELTLLESKNLCMVPKKRKLYTEPLENPFKKMKSNVVDTANSQSAPEVLYGSLLNQQDLKLSRNELELKYPASHGSASESEHRSWARENKSFNVLKQLLLSENCVRDLSQHRSNSVIDGKKKGHKNNVTNSKPEFSISSLNGLMYSSTPPNSCTDNRTFPYQGVAKTPVSPPFPEHLGSVGSKSESGHLNGSSMPSEKGPIKWVITDVDKNEYEKDSPRLTKTNPILYYMLQKGGNSVTSRETQEKDIWREPSSAESVSQVTVKEELLPAAETKTSFFNLRSPYNSHMRNNASHPHSTNGEVYGLLGNVLTIKKESE
ncbi:nuclear receptor-interacting protein 1 [Sorex araneus]|uniref:nuclear receptor-interacting protein 1 n=1 Tax=Sorex araneus TaxID=42254 RepID=UPI002433822D|nr:nuclear receptor-interacting protein 1 [Sorex araneus]XP_054982694.1 nuclear receptor-interacting protein 1 [Sorex araneus]XP_054982695.1 nuclear receptor-interacting protein 1 [Sorex araneus]XP_054982697.1 nuclear receptor-interacting protein 1 [Sorex araneus]